MSAFYHRLITELADATSLALSHRTVAGATLGSRKSDLSCLVAKLMTIYDVESQRRDFDIASSRTYACVALLLPKIDLMNSFISSATACSSSVAERNQSLAPGDS